MWPLSKVKNVPTGWFFKIFFSEWQHWLVMTSIRHLPKWKVFGILQYHGKTIKWALIVNRWNLVSTFMLCEKCVLFVTTKLWSLDLWNVNGKWQVINFNGNSEYMMHIDCFIRLEKFPYLSGGLRTAGIRAWF